MVRCVGLHTVPESLRREWSHPDAFNQRQMSFSRNKAPEFEPGSLQQVPELRLRALSATWCERQHLEIQKFTEVRRVTRWNHSIDDQHLHAAPHRAVAVSEDLNSPFVIPVVEDVLHDVGVAPFGNGRKEIAAEDLAAL